MKKIAVIPARGGSKGIPRKNIYPLLGTPLLSYAIACAKQVSLFDEVVVTSDDEEILAVARGEGASVVERPREISGDFAKMDDAILHVLSVYKERGEQYELVALLQPTSPLRKPDTIRRALEFFEDRWNQFDSLMPVHETSSKVGTIGEDGAFIPSYPPGVQRQELRKLYFDCGTIHLFKTEILEAGAFFGERIYAFPISWPESIDIDTIADMELASWYMSQSPKRE